MQRYSAQTAVEPRMQSKAQKRPQYQMETAAEVPVSAKELIRSYTWDTQMETPINSWAKEAFREFEVLHEQVEKWAPNKVF